ncbi:MAG: Panacea domain-containing protein [Pseudomonadota bacterium]
MPKRDSHTAPRIAFPVKREKVIETMLYVVSKGLSPSAYKIVKLIYLADRAHMREYGRPVSFDHYVAMENGPVASFAYDVMKGVGVNQWELPFRLVKEGGRTYIEDPKRPINRKLFSKSDLQVLDETIQKYGNWSFRQLWDETHDHAAYKRAWGGSTKGAHPMRFEDFFEGIDGADVIIEELEQVAPYMR